MSIGGHGITGGQRINAGDRMQYDRMLSERHYKWGTDCPAVDLDFLMCEFNHGVPVAVVDYKWHGADIDRVNAHTYRALSSFYNARYERLPCFIARYWPDTWAFSVLAINDPARKWLRDNGWVPMSEQQWVLLLYRMRKDALTAGDKAYISRLNKVRPPETIGPRYEHLVERDGQGAIPGLGGA